MQNEEGEGEKKGEKKEMGNPPACNWISRRFVVFARLFTYFFTTRHRHSPRAHRMMYVPCDLFRR